MIRQASHPRHSAYSFILDGAIREDRLKQAGLEREATSEPLDDLPSAEIFCVQVDPYKVAVELGVWTVARKSPRQENASRPKNASS
jgi:hypothetical protein